VRVVRHDRRQPQFPGHFGEVVVVGRVVREPVVDQLDGDVSPPEPVDQPGQLGARGRGSVARQGTADGAFAAAAQHDDVPGQLVDQVFDVVDRAPLLAAGELRAGDHPAEPAVALLLPRDHQQVRPRRIRLTALRRRECEGQLGPEPHPDTEFAGGVVEPDRAVHPVEVGQHQRVELQPGRLFDEGLGVGGPVEEAEVGVDV
jgi:hypothetical protein